MKYTKENLIGTFIKVNTPKQKEKAIAFYKKRGFVVSGMISSMPECICVSRNWKTSTGINVIDSMNLKALSRYQEIDLFHRNRKKFPREMMVSLAKDVWFKRVVIGKVSGEYPFVALHADKKLSEKYLPHAFLWKYAKEIK